MSGRETTVGRLPAAWFVLSVILLITCVAYRGVVRNGFVLDDYHTVVSNHSVRSLTYVGRWLWTPYATADRKESVNYRPILVASYAIDYALWGDEPAGYHMTNLAVHLGVIGLAFLLARRLWGDWVVAACAAGLVAIHPINAEAVNYVSARSSSLMTFFALAALWMYDTAIDRATCQSRWWTHRFLFGSMLIACLAALGTKESAVVLPALVIVWDRMRFGDGDAWRVTLRRSLPVWGVTAAYLILRRAVLGDPLGTPILHPSIPQGVFFTVKIYLTSLGLWLWPAGLAVDRAWPWVIGVFEGWLLAAGAVSAAVGTWAIARWDRRIGWCMVWFWVALLPMAALPWVARLTLYQDNREYLSEIGLAWGVAALMVRGAWLLPRSRVIAVGRWIVLTVLVVVGVRVDAARTAVWADAEHLWDDVLRTHPDSVLGLNARGLHLAESGRLDEARQVFERSITVIPVLAATHDGMGVVYGLMGDLERAIGEFNRAVQLNPRYGPARVNLGKAYEQAGRPDLALKEYERVLRDDPENANALGRSGALLEGQGRLADAAERYRRVLAIDPWDDDVREALGLACLQLERWSEAREAFEALVARHPESAVLHFNLAAAAERTGEPQKAVEHYRAFLDGASFDKPYDAMRARASAALVRLRQSAQSPVGRLGD